jgi:hypothetical protein
MSNFQIEVRKTSHKFKEVVVEVNGAQSTLGLLNASECKELATELKAAIYDLTGENLETPAERFAAENNHEIGDMIAEDPLRDCQE